jgi:hypothetical protein
MSLAQNVAGQINLSANFNQVATGDLSGGNPLNEIITDVLQYANNNGVNYGVDQLYAAKTTLASTTETLHFETATAKDPFGNTLAMLRIREIIVKNLNTTLGQDLHVYAPASNGITWLPPVANYLVVRPGGVLRISDPLSFGAGVGQVVGATSDGLTLDSGSNTVTFSILVLGNSTA